MINRNSILAAAFMLIAATIPAVAQPLVIRLWPNGAPGSIRNPRYREDTVLTEKGEPRIRHVTDPELFVYLPEGNRSLPSPAVLICPGGGYIRLAMDHEGFAVARWFQQHGIAGIVLKYRLPSDSIMADRQLGPLQDIQEAIRTVRRKAIEWHLNPDQVGVMGFSAGGHVAALASTLYRDAAYAPADTTSARPDFSLFIYGVLSMREKLSHEGSRRALLGPSPDSQTVRRFSTELQVNDSTPPAFLVHSANDPTVPFAGTIAYFTALREHSVPAELHLYQTGGHGYGLGKGTGTESGWPEACIDWLKARGILH